MAAKGFIELLRLAERGKGRQQQVDTQSRWSGVAFSLFGQQLVVPLGDVAEVIYLTEWTSVPLSQPWMLGISNLRGRLVSLIDLASFFSDQPVTLQPESKVLLLAHDEHAVGVVVDQVYGIQHFDSRSYFSSLAPQSSLPESLQTYCKGYFMYKNKAWQVVVLHELLTNSKFMNPVIERA